MTNTLWLYLVAGFLILHGIGHVGGSWFFNRSWLSPKLAHGAWKWLFTAVWFVAMIGFIARASACCSISLGGVQQQSPCRWSR